MKRANILTYPIEVLRAEIDKLNKETPINNENSSHTEKMYHLDKMTQVFEAIELLQNKHLEIINKIKEM